MLIYVILLILISMFGISYKRGYITKRQFIISCYIMFTLLAAFRSTDVGTDSHMYESAFVSGKGTYSNRFEPGFRVLCSILWRISESPRILFATTAVIANFGYMYFIYNSTNRVYEAVMLYVLMNFYFDTYNLMRQCCAVSILLIGIVCYRRKKLIKFIVLWLIACQFHYSCYAYIIVPLIDIVNKKINSLKLKIVLVVVAIIIAYFATPIIYQTVMQNEGIGSNYYYYKSGVYVERNTFGSLLMVALYSCVLIYSYINKGRMKKTYQDTLLFYMINVSVAVVFYTMAIQVEIFSRFVHYFTPSSIILISNTLPKDRKPRSYLETCLVYAVFIAYWLIIIFTRSWWNGAVPYKFM